MPKMILNYPACISALEAVEHIFQNLGVENGYSIKKQGNSIVVDADEFYIDILQEKLIGNTRGKA